MKADEVTEELPLNDERKKRSRNEIVANNQLTKRRNKLVAQRDALNADIARLDKAIEALK